MCLIVIVLSLVLVGLVHVYDVFFEICLFMYFSVFGKYGVVLVIKGNLCLLWCDLEGEGGVGKDSMIDIVILGIWSVYVVMEVVWVVFWLEIEYGLGFYMLLYFLIDYICLESVWFDVKWVLVEVFYFYLEVGLNVFFVVIDYWMYWVFLVECIYWGMLEVYVIV